MMNDEVKSLYKTIYEKTKLKEKKKLETYYKILNGCSRKIKWCNNNNQFECYFEIPTFMLGCPLYNINECAYFIIQKLQHQKFKTLFYNPDFLVEIGIKGPKIDNDKFYKPNGIIYISWIHIKEKIDNKYI
jgi:hypothetical protein